LPRVGKRLVGHAGMKILMGGSRRNSVACAEQTRDLNRRSQKQASGYDSPNFAMSYRGRPPGVLLYGRSGNARPRAGEGMERLGKFLAGSETVLGIFCEAARNDAVKLGRHCRIVVRREHGGVVQNLGADRANRLSVKGPDASQHLIKNNAERELVRTVILKLTLDLFWRHIRGRTHDAAGKRKLRGQASDAKVTKSDSVFRIDENVSGLDVTVNDSCTMGRGECTGQIRCPGTGALNGQGRGFEVALEGLAGDVFHDEVRRTPLVDANIIELHDGRMRELADNLRFAQELLLQVLAEGINESLEGHGAANDIVAGFFDAARGSGPDQLQSLVAAFLRCDHQAERRRREARSRKPLLPLVCGTGTGVAGLRRARG